MDMSFYARGAGLSLSAGESVELAARHGFSAVDLMVRDLVEQGEEPGELRRRMDGLGVRGGAWALPVQWRGDSAWFERDLKALPELAGVAASLDLGRTSTWVLPAGLLPGVEDGPDARKRLIDAHVERLGRIARVLGREGIRLGLEVIGVETFRAGRGPEFLHRLGDPDVRVLIDRLNAALPAGFPRVGLLLDTFHLHAAGETVEEALALFDPGCVVWVHVADLPADFQGGRGEILDQDRGLPGESGQVPCSAVLQALDERGLEGPVSAEPLSGCRGLQGRSADEVARLCGEAMRGVWPPEARRERSVIHPAPAG
jgi:sugar phosphate isomerase/epimerase